MNKADKIFKDFKTVEFKVTSYYGARKEGAIVKVKLINIDEDTGIAVLYHPSTKNETGMFNLATKDKNGIYLSKGELYSNYDVFGK